MNEITQLFDNWNPIARNLVTFTFSKLNSSAAAAFISSISKWDNTVMIHQILMT